LVDRTDLAAHVALDVSPATQMAPSWAQMAPSWAHMAPSWACHRWTCHRRHRWRRLGHTWRR